MAFSQFPPEVLDQIAFYLSAETRLSSLATISLSFQRAVEDRLFSSLQVSSQDLDVFADLIASAANRKVAIKRIKFSVVLPAYPGEACSWFETERDKRANNESFTAAIARLFTLLSICDNVHPAKPISLSISSIFSPTDVIHRDRDKTAAARSARFFDPGTDLFEHRYEHSFIRLRNPESLPLLNRVNSFDVYADTPRYMAPATAALIASKFPSLAKVQWQLHDGERKYKASRIALRQAFARELQSLHLSNVTSLRLALKHDSPANEAHTNFDVRDEDVSPADGFSASLGNFLRISNLVTITLEGPICIGPEVFWRGDQVSPLINSWHHLRDFSVTLSAVRPDGGWYFARSPINQENDDDSDNDTAQRAAWHGWDEGFDTESSGYDSDQSFFNVDERPPDDYDEHRERYRQGRSPTRSFRTIPSTELEDLFEAAARAAAHMPALRTFAVGADIQPSPRTSYKPQVCEFNFAAAGFQHWKDQDPDDTNHRRLYWVGPREWSPGQQLSTRWEEALGQENLIRCEKW